MMKEIRKKFIILISVPFVIFPICIMTVEFFDRFFLVSFNEQRILFILQFMCMGLALLCIRDLRNEICPRCGNYFFRRGILNIPSFSHFSLFGCLHCGASLFSNLKETE